MIHSKERSETNIPSYKPDPDPVFYHGRFFLIKEEFEARNEISDVRF
jgi:hypothetical protein